MNISSDAIRAVRDRGGSADPDRPERTDSALEADRRVGKNNGKPLVPHPKGAEEGLQVGERRPDCYSHYPSRATDLIDPEAQDFVSELFSRVESYEQAAEELNDREDRVRKVAEVHRVEPSGDRDGTENDPSVIEFPSGESWDTEYLTSPAWKDPRTLSQLIGTDGYSVAEAAQYLSYQLDEDISESQIRDACRDCGLLESRDDTDDRPDSEEVVMSSTGMEREVPESTDGEEDEWGHELESPVGGSYRNRYQ